MQAAAAQVASSPRRKRKPEGRSWLPWIIAGVVVVVVLGLILLSSHRERAAQQAENASQAPDPYASQLSIGNLQMSEAANFAGSKVTYVDGTIANKGDKTVTGVNVVVTFKNDIGEPPQKIADAAESDPDAGALCGY